MQPDSPVVAGAFEAGLDPAQEVLGQRAVGEREVRWDEPAVQQKTDGLLSKDLDADLRPHLEPAAGPHCVEAPGEAAELQQMFRVVELRRATAAARKHREAELVVEMQGAAIARIAAGCHHRDLGGCQLMGEVVLLLDGGVRPAVWAVEFRDHGFGLLEAHLVDAVFVAVEGKQAAVTPETHALHRRQNLLGLQLPISEGRGVGLHQHNLAQPR